MFQTSSPESRLGAAIYLSERIYHASVRKVRQKHGNALLSILVTIGQTALFTLAFYIMFAILPIRAAGIRGGFFIFQKSGLKPPTSVGKDPTVRRRRSKPLNPSTLVGGGSLGSLYLLKQ